MYYARRGRKKRGGLSFGRALVSLAAFCFLIATAAYLYTVSVWNPDMPALLVERVDHISATHGGFVPLPDIPVFLQRALIATEDRSFYHNYGVDFEGLARALWVDLQSGRPVQGGSTITEQLVKDIFLTDQKTIPRKLKQIVYAVLISRYFTKNRILALYLNEVYLGQNAYGVGEAARTYFGKPVRDLSPAQSALIAGLPQAPSLYDPFAHYRLAKQRQAEVLQSMAAVGFITGAEAQVLERAPLHLARRP